MREERISLQLGILMCGRQEESMMH